MPTAMLFLSYPRGININSFLIQLPSELQDVGKLQRRDAFPAGPQYLSRVLQGGPISRSEPTIQPSNHCSGPPSTVAGSTMVRTNNRYSSWTNSTSIPQLGFGSQEHLACFEQFQFQSIYLLLHACVCVPAGVSILWFIEGHGWPCIYFQSCGGYAQHISGDSSGFI